jgi:uncharacterized protein YjiK
MYTIRTTIPLLQVHFSFFLCMAVAVTGCRNNNKQYNNPANYNLNKPYVIKLPAELNDISGIAYYGKDNSLFAESDEKGCLYKIFLNKPTDIRKWKFSHKRDYEDIVLLDSTFYVLNNNGDITSLNFLKDSLITHDYTFPENGKYEFESLYYDDKIQKLVLICKDCEIDKNTATSTYTFDPQRSIYGSSYSIDTKNIAEKTSPRSIKFKPSAASINPVTGELYIISSINKLLVVADRNGGVKEIYQLDPAIFIHPEGIAFTPTGSLFISNEADESTPAQVLYYQFKKGADK